MKKFSLTALPLILVILASGCSATIRNQAGIPEKNILLPEKAGIKSTPAGGFTALGKCWPSEQTEATVTRIHKKGKPAMLRFEIVCFGDTSSLEWSKKKPADDMTLFNGEHIELLIAPFGLNEGGVYYHIALNPAGSIYHAKKRDTKWALSTKSYIEIRKDRWIATIDFPDSFSIKEHNAKTVWNLNIARTIKKKGKSPEHSSWTGSSDFHDITTMGQLHFSGEQPVDQLRIFNCGINSENKLELNIAKTGKEQAILQVFDGDDLVASQKISGIEPINLKYNLDKKYVQLKGQKRISLYLLDPRRIPLQNFTGNITSDAVFLSLDKMEYIGEKEMLCKFFQVPGKIVIKNDKKIFLTQDVTEKETKISLEGLKPGRYIWDYSTQGKHSSRVFFITETPLKKVSEIPEKGKLSVKGNELLLDGKPFYLLGISGGSKTHYLHPAEFSLRYGNGYRKNALIYQGFPGKRLVWKPATGYAFYKNWKNMISTHLEKLKKTEKPAWYTLCYEANLPVMFTELNGSLRVDPEGYKVYKQIYDMAKKELPDSVLSIQIDNLALAPNYINSCDVLEYAAGTSSYHPIDMIQNLGKDFDKLREAAGTKPLIPWLGGTIPHPEKRTAEEVRAGVYYTILKGGAGNIIHMGHGGMPKERTRFWSMLTMLSREIDSFYSDFKTWKSLEFTVPEKLIGKAVQGPSGELLVVILNTTAAEIQTEIDFPGFGKQILTFTPYEPRVFRMSSTGTPEKKESPKKTNEPENKK